MHTPGHLVGALDPNPFASLGHVACETCSHLVQDALFKVFHVNYLHTLVWLRTLDRRARGITTTVVIPPPP